MAQTKLTEVLEKLRRTIPDIQAIVLLGPDGVMDHVRVDPRLNIETIAVEYGTLLRIAGRASEDTGAGNLIEHIVVSEKSVMIGRTVSKEHFLILLSSSQDQIGRARYELKQAAWEIGLAKNRV